MSLKINKDQIVSVTQYNQLKSRYYDTWIEGGKNTLLFGLIKVDEWDAGYKSSFLRSYFTKEEWEKDGYYEKEPKGGLYYKPHLIISMSNKNDINKSFETIEEMEIWVDVNLRGVNLITIRE
jgi:hypothetical protein